MTKANLKNILTAVRDMIRRSRIAYKDYLGEETVTGAKVLVEGTLSEEGSLILKDPSFTGFVAGADYEVTIDGTTQTLTAVLVDNIVGLTNVTDFNNPGENYFLVYIVPGNDKPACQAKGNYIGKTIFISQTKTTTTKKYDIKKVPQELIPDTIARSVDVAKVGKKANDASYQAREAKITANNAQTAADTAQTAAETAQTAAETAQTAANNAQTAANNAQTAADTAQTAANNAVKPAKQVKDGCIYFMRNPYADYKYTGVVIGTSGGTALGIEVNKEQYPSVAFVPPVYGFNQADFEFRRLNETYPHPLITGIGGIVVYSSTPKSTKKFKITVDDSGAIRATEVM